MGVGLFFGLASEKKWKKSPTPLGLFPRIHCNVLTSSVKCRVEQRKINQNGAVHCFLRQMEHFVR